MSKRTLPVPVPEETEAEAYVLQLPEELLCEVIRLCYDVGEHNRSQELLLALKLLGRLTHVCRAWQQVITTHWLSQIHTTQHLPWGTDFRCLLLLSHLKTLDTWNHGNKESLTRQSLDALPLDRLETLSIDADHLTQLSGCQKFWTATSQLRSFSVYHHVVGSNRATIAQLTTLRHLEKLSLVLDESPRQLSLASLPRLHTLYLHACRIPMAMEQWLQPHPSWLQLRTLSLRCRDDLCANLSALSNLTRLKLVVHNDPGGRTVENGLSALTQLQRLSLKGGRRFNRMVPHTLTQLTTLSLRDISTDDVDLTQWQPLLTQLTTLKLENVVDTLLEPLRFSLPHLTTFKYKDGRPALSLSILCASPNLRSLSLLQFRDGVRLDASLRGFFHHAVATASLRKLCLTIRGSGVKEAILHTQDMPALCNLTELTMRGVVFERLEHYTTLTRLARLETNGWPIDSDPAGLPPASMPVHCLVNGHNMICHKRSHYGNGGDDCHTSCPRHPLRRLITQ
jgi:hypothetical protein